MSIALDPGTIVHNTTESDDDLAWYVGRVAESREDGMVSIEVLEETPSGSIVVLAGALIDVSRDSVRAVEVRRVGDGYVYAADDDDAGAVVPVTRPILEGFIAPEDGPFEYATSGAAIVRDMHAAVNGWNGWNPVDPPAKRYKSFVEDIEARARKEEEERVFAEGGALSDLRRPPL
jgi:hypothetical protein